MPSKKRPVPSLLCEWMVGTTIAEALGPIPSSPRPRDVVTVEVVTDDETEEDTLKITYPRSGRQHRPNGQERTAKKVRFDEKAAPKSAMKKGKKQKSDSTGTATESDDTVFESADASSSDEKPTGKEAATNSGKKKRGNKTNKPSSDNDTGSDSEPHPDCPCSECVRGREKAKAKGKSPPKEGCKKKKETDQENAKGKNSKKSGKEPSGSEADSEASDTAKDSDKESDGDNKKKTGKKKQPKADEKEEAKGEDKSTAGKDSNPGEKKGKDKEKGNNNAKKGKGSEKITDNKQPSYPEMLPPAHPRRPNLIEPIRAEVVQTERVVETPEDPPPNAYFDAQNNIVRIYHGPVYGNHFGHSLYPKRDRAAQSLPIGMPHPTQNPYYYGFAKGKDEAGQELPPLTQGMPMPAWNAFCPPPNYPAFYPGTYPPPMQAYDGAGGACPSGNGNKGAFAIVDEKAGSTSSKSQDKAGQDNVIPPERGKDNPYYSGRPRLSQFSNFGGSKSGSPSRWKNNASGKSNAGSNDGAADAQSTSNGWDNGNSSDQKSAWGSDQPNTSNQDSGSGKWGQEGNSGNNNESQSGAGSQGNGSGNGTGDAWNNQGDTSSGGGTSNWGESLAQDDGARGSDQSNVMPGSWDNAGSSDAVPAWADPSMAASTGGKVDAPSSGW